MLYQGRALKEKQQGEESYSLGIIAVFLLILIVAGLIMVIIKKCRQARNRQVAQRKTTNDSINLEIVCPSINFNIFYQHILVKLANMEISNKTYFNEFDNCIICLEQFVETDKRPLGDRNKIIIVKLTPCSHLYHQKCLSDWVNRQQSCPTCRLPLTQQNLNSISEQMDINFKKVYQEIYATNKSRGLKIEKVGEKKNQKIKTHYQIEMTRSQIQIQDHDNQRYTMRQWSPDIRYAVTLYTLIIKYHSQKFIEELSRKPSKPLKIQEVQQGEREIKYMFSDSEQSQIEEQGEVKAQTSRIQNR